MANSFARRRYTGSNANENFTGAMADLYPATKRICTRT